jgi:hypothetical protein
LNQKERKTKAAEHAQKDETCFHWLILLEETGKTGAVDAPVFHACTRTESVGGMK